MKRRTVAGSRSQTSLYAFDDAHVLGQKLTHTLYRCLGGFRGIAIERGSGHPYPHLQPTWPVGKNRQAESVARAEPKGERGIDADQMKLVCLVLGQV
jgi:hypothetical protein